MARHLFLDHAPFDRADMAEWLALVTTAEIVMRRGETDRALSLLLRAPAGLAIVDENWLMELEYMPKDEAYMAIWFFGILHELGHAGEVFAHRSGPLSLTEIERQIGIALEHLGVESLGLAKPLDDLAAQRASPLDARHIQAEASADVFATAVLFEATNEVMAAVGAPHSPPALVVELIRSMHAVWFLERCESAATQIVNGATRESLLQLFAHPAIFTPRLSAIRMAASILLAVDAEGGVDADRLAAIDEVFDREFTAEHTAAADQGFARALRVATDIQPISAEELDSFVRDARSRGHGLHDIGKFCALARSLGVGSPTTEHLAAAIVGP